MQNNEIKSWIENNQNEYIKSWLDNNDIKNLFDDQTLMDCINSCSSPQAEKIEDKLDLIFNAFSLFKPEETNILIIGQDPYPNPDKAQGFAFSCQKGKAVSLTKIFEAVDIYNNENKVHNYDLTSWAKENKVLLLNSALTYEGKDKRIKHFNVWKHFIIKIIETLFNQNKLFVIFLWGEKARTLYNDCKKPKDIRIFETCHPNNRHDREKFKTDIINQFKECDELLNKDIWKSL